MLEEDLRPGAYRVGGPVRQLQASRIPADRTAPPAGGRRGLAVAQRRARGLRAHHSQPDYGRRIEIR